MSRFTRERSVNLLKKAQQLIAKGASMGAYEDMVAGPKYADIVWNRLEEMINQMEATR